VSNAGNLHRNESGHVDFSTVPGDYRGGNPIPHGKLVNYPNPGDARDGKFDPKLGLAWRNYPRLALRYTSNEEEQRFLVNEFQNVWNKALEYGIIEMKDDGPRIGQYYYNCRVFPDKNASVTANDLVSYNVRDDSGLLVLGKPLLDFLASASIAKTLGGGVQARTINGSIFELKLFNSGYLSNGSNNIKTAETNAMRALRRQVPLYVALKRTIEMLEPIIEEVKRVNAPRRQVRVWKSTSCELENK
jgi:hypothetical protein